MLLRGVIVVQLILERVAVTLVGGRFLLQTVYHTENMYVTSIHS